ncbi:hypothetical protein VYU27_000666 [Nannochloropsis oceanica]
MLALKRLASASAAQRRALGAVSSVRRMGTLGEELKGAPSKEEEAKYAKVIKVGDKLYGVPAVQEGTFGLDLQQQVGRRWEELVYELNGEVLFNRDPVFALPDQGTKSNPVLVPSGENERIVGYEDPHVHQVFWFKLRKGDLAYVPKIDKYFSLYKID